jgi:hypothetical protein
MRDEITPIANYMANEMNVNRTCADAKKIKALNDDDGTACINEYIKASFWRKLFGAATPPSTCMDMVISSHLAAMLLWAGKVNYGKDWDHKPKILKKFVSKTTGRGDWHAYHNTLYYHDIWSNIHYGYIGLAVGFSEDTLLKGAAAAQIGSEISHGNIPPSYQGGYDGIQKYDDPSDQNAIKIGFDLRYSLPTHVKSKDILDRIFAYEWGLDTKPVSDDKWEDD